MKIRINEVDYTYQPGDTWNVEVGRGDRGAYKPRYMLPLPHMGVRYFDCINIGNGYKKRLVLVRATGERVLIVKAAS